MAALFCNFVIWNQEQGQSRRSKRRANQAYLHENWCAANIPPQDPPRQLFTVGKGGAGAEWLAQQRLPSNA